MIKKLLFASGISIVAFSLSYSSVFSNKTGALPGYTGAPGESTCAAGGCHTGNPVTSNSKNMRVLVTDGTNPDPLTEYQPGKTYDVTVGIGSNGGPAYGFETSVKKGTGGITAGKLSKGTDNSVQVLSSGAYVTHTNTDPISAGTDMWRFKWTAPAAGTGKVTFYTAVNVANGDVTTFGDSIHLKSITLNEAAGSGIAQADIFKQNMKMYPTQVSSFLHTEFTNSETASVSARIYSLDGKLVRNFDFGQRSAGAQELHMDLTGLSKGCYLVQLQAGTNAATGKIIKE